MARSRLLPVATEGVIGSRTTESTDRNQLTAGFVQEGSHGLLLQHGAGGDASGTAERGGGGGGGTIGGGGGRAAAGGQGGQAGRGVLLLQLSLAHVLPLRQRHVQRLALRRATTDSIRWPQQLCGSAR